MFDTVDEVNYFYEEILQDSRKITYQDEHIIYETSHKYGKTSRRLASGRKIQFYIHQLALLYKIKKTKLDDGLETSHLCHNHGCININHINYEPHSINMMRERPVETRRSAMVTLATQAVFEG